MERGGVMPAFEKLYYKSFNAMTSAQLLLQQAIILLQSVQQECEEFYIGDDTTASQDAPL